MELVLDGEVIRGHCIDRYTREYFDTPAKIEGTLINNELSLIKTYPYFLGLDENDKTFVEKSLPSQEIHYLGKLKVKLFSNDHYVESTWNISGSYLDEQGNAQYYTDAGDWEMRRIR